MKKDLILDYDPIKDGSWNLSPFHSDYVTPRRKSSVIDPFELMPAYPDFDAAPDAPPPTPKTRALSGLDDFGTEKLDMYDLVHKSSDHGLPMPVVEEFQIANEPNRKRIYDNVRKAQDWYLSAAEEQIADQTYAVNFANAARSARDSDDDHAGFGSVQSTALKHDVMPMELHDYINGGPEAQTAIIEAMNNRIMPWAPGSGPADIGLYRNFSALEDQESMRESDAIDDTDWGVPETINNRDGAAAGPGNASSADDEAEPMNLHRQYAANQHQTSMTDATQEPLQLAQVSQPKNSPAPPQKGLSSQTKGKVHQPSGPRKVLFDPETEKTLWQIRQLESTQNYKVVNSDGYKGAYQMGNPALVDAGMMVEIKPKKYKWTGKYGVNSLQDFLNNPNAQDRAVMDFLRAVKRQLKGQKKGEIANTSIGKTVQGVGGTFVITQDSLIAAAHRRGAGAVKKYLDRLQKNGWNSHIKSMAPSNLRTIQLEIETRLHGFANHKINIQ
ncbi:MAG: hypothetical protein QF384_00125 [Alphaproteobacteria bacterium]|jgi:hypothetical protein|nr:hypothetical protein [Alphaproteobacteria bacterium]